MGLEEALEGREVLEVTVAAQEAFPESQEDSPKLVSLH
jgi:FKBP-type peptidyl-prolyl cis-trans isomerase 2